MLLSFSLFVHKTLRKKQFFAEAGEFLGSPGAKAAKLDATGWTRCLPCSGERRLLAGTALRPLYPLLKVA